VRRGKTLIIIVALMIIIIIVIGALIPYIGSIKKTGGEERGVVAIVHVGEMNNLVIDRNVAIKISANLTKFWELATGSNYAIVLNNSEARLLIIEFIDPLCPHCVAMLNRVGKELINLYENGTASIVIVYSPTATWSLTRRAAAYSVLSLSIWETWRKANEPLREMVKTMKHLAAMLRSGRFPEPPNASNSEVVDALAKLGEASDFTFAVAKSLGIEFRGTPTTVIIFLK